MKVISLFFILLLTAIWAYTSWYWYTCDIKGFCDSKTIQSIAQKKNVGNGDSQIITGADIAGDILNGSNIDQEAPRRETSVEIPEETPENIGENQNASVLVSNDEAKEVKTETLALCQNPLIPSIALGQRNNAAEVRKLEEFLTQRYDYIDRSPGVFDDTDFEIVKKFQQEFRSEVLDPWGLNNPTGFVGTTTVKKINEIACN